MIFTKGRRNFVVNQFNRDVETYKVFERNEVVCLYSDQAAEEEISHELMRHRIPHCKVDTSGKLTTVSGYVPNSAHSGPQSSFTLARGRRVDSTIESDDLFFLFMSEFVQLWDM